MLNRWLFSLIVTIRPCMQSVYVRRTVRYIQNAFDVTARLLCQPISCDRLSTKPASTIFNNIEDEERQLSWGIRPSRHTAKLSIVICPTNSLSQHNNTFFNLFPSAFACVFVCARAYALCCWCISGGNVLRSYYHRGRTKTTSRKIFEQICFSFVWNNVCLASKGTIWNNRNGFVQCVRCVLYATPMLTKR